MFHSDTMVFTFILTSVFRETWNFLKHLSSTNLAKSSSTDYGHIFEI